MASLRTFLVLGRTSNLPTVWSNCLAGWCLGGRGNRDHLPLLLAGATLLYLGGMFLNDAFDANFDGQHRRERPIPSGAISARTVWRFGFALLGLGLGCLCAIGPVTGILGFILCICILIYDAIHKLITVSPVLMAACRFLLYMVAASAAAWGVTGWAVWCGFALAAYIIGLSYLAKKESTRASFRYWPVALLAVPIVLAFIMNAGDYQQKAMLISLVLALWIVQCLRYTFFALERNIGHTVSGLLAGIVWVDLLAVAYVENPLPLVFVGLFLLALFFQRFIPAT
jgi:4-hydroxybenzoate polyprenyltransferase